MRLTNEKTKVKIIFIASKNIRLFFKRACALNQCFLNEIDLNFMEEKIWNLLKWKLTKIRT